LLLAAVPVVGLMSGLGSAVPIGAATTERVVSDRNTGLAISGFDPVTYFTDGKAAPGADDHEYSYAGVVWRFRNEGNLAAFAADPDIYMPRFGGYDPTGVARGVAVPGHPEIWLVAAGRLYLFATPTARGAFVADATEITAAADRTWPAVALKLAR